MKKSLKNWLALLLAAVLPLLALAACGGAEVDTSSQGAPGQASQSDASASETPENERYVLIEITMESGGVMRLELDREAAPITVQNFVDLVNEGFYDGLVFHRVLKDFMIQGGCPDGTGTGGPGYSIKGEFAENGWDNPILHTRGVISMARGGNPDSAGSQFFIVHKTSPHLDSKYAAFGQVTMGLDVLDEIAAVECGPGSDGAKSAPLEPVVIQSIRVIKADA